MAPIATRLRRISNRHMPGPLQRWKRQADPERSQGRRSESQPLRRVSLIICAVAITSFLTAVPSSASAQPQKSLTVVEVNLEWPSLDPEVNTEENNDTNLENAIYGGLFAKNPSAGCTNGCKNAGAIVPDLATGYSFSPDGLTLTINLRHGVKFQDGTPFNAQAVKFNIDRDLAPSSGCTCKSNFSVVSSVTTQGNYTVLLHLAHRDTPLIDAFISQSPNWIISPTALAKEGENKFGQHPVGAGPFEVVSDYASNQLTLRRYPGYWQKGLPKLQNLKFITLGSDEAAYSALKAGSAQVLIGVTTADIINQAKTEFRTVLVPAITLNDVEFNTRTAPFNNQLAREAVAYATDPEAIIDKLYPHLASPIEDETGPGGQYFEKNVPGYRHYDLAKAKALVKQLGGLSFTFETTNDPVSENLVVALQSEWQLAGIKTTIKPVPLTTEVSDMEAGNWNAVTGGAGGVDPDIGVQSLGSRFDSTGSFTCCHDSVLDSLITQSLTTSAPSARQKVFDQIYKYVTEKQYTVDLFSEPFAIIGDQSLKGLDPLVANSAGSVAVPWQYVS